MNSQRMLSYSFLFLIVVSISGCNSTNSHNLVGGYKLVWSDEFTNSGLPDSTKWFYDTLGNFAGWGNNELQYYTYTDTQNAFVNGDILKITAQKGKYKYRDYTSARLVSNVGWRYGRVEVRAKLPGGKGTWPAIWMMPQDWSFNEGNWPDVGEIDIMEHVGHTNGIIHASAHSKNYQWQIGTQKTGTIQINDVTEKFHVYKLEWDPAVMKCFVDDSLFFEYVNEGLGEDAWPYNKPFSLILNVAVGGAWGGAQGIDDNAFPQIMEVDYVRIYQQ